MLDRAGGERGEAGAVDAAGGGNVNVMVADHASDGVWGDADMPEVKGSAALADMDEDVVVSGFGGDRGHVSSGQLR